jgi:hypothetical protein
MKAHDQARLELQDIFNRYGDEFCKEAPLSFVQAKAVEAIRNCRTAKMGSHTRQCDKCGHIEVSYNSCRNRHCPKCQWIKEQVWIDRVKSQLLPVRYFHVVFTLPGTLNPIVMLNHAVIYDFLFAASWGALQQVTRNPAFLGAQTGALAILHTWGQTLTLHPHVHMLVPAGGLDADGWQWHNSAKKFFVPVKALSKIFRARFIKLLLEAINEKKLLIPEGQTLFSNPDELKKLLYKKDWVVYCKKCFAGPGQAITYLGRYTHRVAISNSRIIKSENNTITFRWKDYRDHNQWKAMELTAGEFIRRFLLHILPRGFYKIRYFGIFAVASRKTKLQQCFYLLGCHRTQPIYAGLSNGIILFLITGKDTFICPVCKKGKMCLLHPPNELF